MAALGIVKLALIPVTAFEMFESGLVSLRLVLETNAWNQYNKHNR